MNESFWASALKIFEKYGMKMFEGIDHAEKCSCGIYVTTMDPFMAGLEASA